MAEYQDRINDMRSTIENYINEKMKAKETFSLDNLKKFMENRVFGAKDSFLRFMYARIFERPIAESTRHAHISIYNTLKHWGHIRQFSDITDANLKLWDDLSHQNAQKAKSVWNYHKILKIYCREAKRFGHIKDNPYDYMKFKRDNAPGHRFITMEEIEIIIENEEELSFDEVASITDAFYVNGVPGEVESFAYDLIDDEMREFGFRTKFVHFN